MILDVGLELIVGILKVFSSSLGIIDPSNFARPMVPPVALDTISTPLSHSIQFAPSLIYGIEVLAMSTYSRSYIFFKLLVRMAPEDALPDGPRSSMRHRGIRFRVRSSLAHVP